MNTVLSNLIILLGVPIYQQDQRKVKINQGMRTVRLREPLEKTSVRQKCRPTTPTCRIIRLKYWRNTNNMTETNRDPEMSLSVALSAQRSSLRTTLSAYSLADIYITDAVSTHGSWISVAHVLYGKPFSKSRSHPGRVE